MFLMASRAVTGARSQQWIRGTGQLLWGGAVVLALASKPEPPSPQQPVPTALSRRRWERTENMAQETEWVVSLLPGDLVGGERGASWGREARQDTG